MIAKKGADLKALIQLYWMGKTKWYCELKKSFKSVTSRGSNWISSTHPGWCLLLQRQCSTNGSLYYLLSLGWCCCCCGCCDIV